eukprot:COSAG04_NODE_423_length_14604_cov_8.047777_2_plen_188_part_00
MPLQRALVVIAIAATAAAEGPAADPRDTYCTLDVESGGAACETCAACEGWPGAQSRGECAEACGSGHRKRYVISSHENSRGSHNPIIFRCDDAIEQAEGEFCCFRSGDGVRGGPSWRVHCFDAGQPLARYEARTGGTVSGAGRNAFLPFDGKGWRYFEESFQVGGGEMYNSFGLNLTVEEYTGARWA